MKGARGALLGFMLVALAAPAAGQKGHEHTAQLLRSRIESSVSADGSATVVPVGDEFLHASASLLSFYERRDYELAWADDSLTRVSALLQAIRRAGRDGLRPQDYHLARLELLASRVAADRVEDRGTAVDVLIDLDLLATDAMLVFASHLLVGRVDPIALDPEWRVNRRNVDLVAAVENALATGFIEEALTELLPPYIEYRSLRDALARYRRLQREGGWPRIEAGGTMSPGDRGENIAALRRRLAASNDLDPRLRGGNRYDADVTAAVRRFQERHGLDETGVVDLLTLAELAAPIEQRIDALIVNMERWRWLPQELGEKHARVNIAGFDMSVYENDHRVDHYRAMVGHQYRRTPVFSDTISLVVFAPWWHVPRSIGVADIVPRLIEEGADYAARNRIQVLRGWGTNARRVDPANVRWAQVDTAAFPYHFRQEPGPTNPLGHVKFMFPNEFDVYVHDTYQREMFNRAERAFSSGCIRIENPERFAAYLLRAGGWTDERIQAAMTAPTEQSVSVPEPLPIHILYWTAWAAEDGRIHFRNDIYRRDEPLQRALEEPAPTASTASKGSFGR